MKHLRTLFISLSWVFIVVTAWSQSGYIVNSSGGGGYVTLSDGMWIPSTLGLRYTEETAVVSIAVQASQQFLSHCGSVYVPGGGSKSIRFVEFRFGTVVKAAGSNARVTLAPVDLTSGPPVIPGAGGETVTIANADGGFVSNTWYTTGALSADRSVTSGDDFCGVKVSAVSN